MGNRPQNRLRGRASRPRACASPASGTRSSPSCAARRTGRRPARLLRRAREIDGRVSLATVYRTLNCLERRSPRRAPDSAALSPQRSARPSSKRAPAPALDQGEGDARRPLLAACAASSSGSTGSSASHPALPQVAPRRRPAPGPVPTAERDSVGQEQRQRRRDRQRRRRAGAQRHPQHLAAVGARDRGYAPCSRRPGSRAASLGTPLRSARRRAGRRTRRGPPAAGSRQVSVLTALC